MLCLGQPLHPVVAHVAYRNLQAMDTVGVADHMLGPLEHGGAARAAEPPRTYQPLVLHLVGSRNVRHIRQDALSLDNLAQLLPVDTDASVLVLAGDVAGDLGRGDNGLAGQADQGLEPAVDEQPPGCEHLRGHIIQLDQLIRRY